MDEQEWLSSEEPAAMLEHLRGLGYTAGLLGEKHAPGATSNRKLRLWACACVRQVWPLLTDARGRKAVEVAERYADSPTFGEELIFAAAFLGDNLQPTELSEFAAWYVSRRAPVPDTGGVFPQGWPAAATQAVLLRCVVGNPFRPVRLAPVEPDNVFSALDVLGRELGSEATCVRRDWLAPTVISLAQAAYSERDRKCLACNRWTDCKWCENTRRLPSEDGSLDPARLAILADALEEAGCQPELYAIERRGSQAVKVSHANPLLAHLRGPGPHVRGCWAVDLVLGRG